MAIQDLLDEVGGRISRLERQREDLASGGFDLFAAGDEMAPVGTFDEEVGEHGGDQFAGGIFVEKSNGIDGFEIHGDGGASLFGEDGSRRPLEALYAGVGVQGENQHFAKRAGGFEQTDVPRMKDVVTAIGEDDALALLAPDGALLNEGGTREKLGHGYTFSL